MEKLTINQALVMRKSLIERRNQLKELVESSSRSRLYGLGDEKVKEDATFNVQAADAQKVMIDLALFDLDSAIKQANATATLSLPDGFNFRGLMSPIEAKK